MVTQKQRLIKIDPQQLDAYLDKGWFRMGQTMFITHFLQLDLQFHSAIWLRYRLNEDTEKVILKKLKPIEKKFFVDFQSWRYTLEQESLYSVYVADSGLNIKDDLLGLMLGWEEENIFDTRQASIYDGMRLIATGLLDFGKSTAAGICNFYHPDYKKYSLGKALMYAKMRACLEAGLTYFYPGYAVPGYCRFNYKLNMLPGNTEYFHPVFNSWLPYNHGTALPDLLEVMHKGLFILQQEMNRLKMQTILLYYTYFDSILVDSLSKMELNQPVFLYLDFVPGLNIGMIILYDLYTGHYKVALTNTVAPEAFYQFNHRNVNSQVIQIYKSLGTFEDPKMVADSIQQLLGNVSDFKSQLFK